MKTPTRCAPLFLVSGLLVSGLSGAQTPPWTVTVTPTLNPLPLGMCGAVHLTLLDPATRDVPRNPQGYRINMADFDMSVSGGTSAAGHQIDASHFEACGCQGGAAGTTVSVTARYPAQSLPAAKRVAGVLIQQSATFVLALPKGTVNPQSCVMLAAGTPASAAAGGAPAAGGSPAAAASGAAQAGAPGAAVGAASARGPSAVTTPISPPVGTPATGAPATPPASAGPTPTNPIFFSVKQMGAGEVEMKWLQVPDASFYVVFGPGLTPGGQRVENTNPNLASGWPEIVLRASGVPSGTHEWKVGSFYSPGNVSTAAERFASYSAEVTGPASTPASSTPAAAAAPTPASGNYLVTITGFRAYQASMDDPLSRDGVGDEVYAAAYVRRYDRRTSQLVDAVMRTSAVQGDVFHFGNQRLQAGTRSQTGGIQDGDPVPDGPLVAMRSVAAQDATFPLRLWQGTLTDGVDTLILSPSLWEQDGSDAYFAQWAQHQQTLNLSLFTKPGVQNEMAQKEFRALKFGMSGNSTNAGAEAFSRIYGDIAMVFGGGVPIISLLATSADRPLGLVENGPDRTALPNHAVVLTREIIEAALARQPLGAIPSPVLNNSVSAMTGVSPVVRLPVLAPKPGIIVVHFQDATGATGVLFPERPAIYQMFIQVEHAP